MSRLIYCKRLAKDLVGLKEPPFPGKLGQEIFAHTSEESWQAWLDLQMKIINEYKLNLADEKHQDVLEEQMRNFLNLNDKSQPKKGSKILHVGTPV